MDDEYEVFSNDDTELMNEKEEKSRKIDRNTVSIIMMSFVIIVCIANLVVSVITYKKYDELQVGAQFYFQNGAEATTLSSGIVVDEANDVFAQPETTTVLHIEITTQSQSISTSAAPVKTTASQTVTTQTATTEAPTTQSAAVQTTSPETKSSLININTASAEELTALNGVGEAKAQAIIEYREENGYFSSIEEITNVSGIGEKTFEKNKDLITVD